MAKNDRKISLKRARNAQARRKRGAEGVDSVRAAARALGSLGGLARKRALADDPERRKAIAKAGGDAAARNRRDAKVLAS